MYLSMYFYLTTTIAGEPVSMMLFALDKSFPIEPLYVRRNTTTATTATTT
jgi:hypothetical protein